MGPAFRPPVSRCLAWLLRRCTRSAAGGNHSANRTHSVLQGKPGASGRTLRRTDEKHKAEGRLSDEDKAVVRRNILEAVVQCPALLRCAGHAAFHFPRPPLLPQERYGCQLIPFTQVLYEYMFYMWRFSVLPCPALCSSQLAECLKSIVDCDYPERWPDYDSTVLQLLATQELQRMYCALLSLRVLARKYEYKVMRGSAACFSPARLRCLRRPAARRSSRDPPLWRPTGGPACWPGRTPLQRPSLKWRSYPSAAE